MKTIFTCAFCISLFCNAIGQEMAALAIPYKTSVLAGEAKTKKAPRTKAVNHTEAFSYRIGEQDLCTVAPRLGGDVYRIQLDVNRGYSEEVPVVESLARFGDIYPEYLLNKSLTRLMMGNFVSFDAASSALDICWKQGFEHAFVVKYSDGFRVEE
jgi:hypothetical protein